MMASCEMKRELVKAIDKGIDIKNAYIIVKVANEIKWKESKKEPAKDSNH